MGIIQSDQGHQIKEKYPRLGIFIFAIDIILRYNKNVVGCSNNGV